MKNQFTSRIVKFTFAFMFILIASSCSEDNDAMDAAVLAKEINSEIAAKGAKVSASVTYTSTITGMGSTFCVDDTQTFTLSGWNSGAQLNVQIYDASILDWVSIDSFIGQLTSPQSLSYTFPATGVYSLRYQVSGSAANGGTNGFVYFDLTAENCTVCTESESSTAYAGNDAGATVTGAGGNNAWWYYLDIADGLNNVTADVWEGKSNDIGDVTYNAITKRITITLDDWFLETGNIESVKWYSFATLPTDGRPSPGQAPNKGTSLSFDTIQGHRYYAIHLDVATCE